MIDVKLGTQIEAELKRQIPEIPLGRIEVTLTQSGKLHLVTVVLADDRPGWRCKDRPNRRGDAKRIIRPLVAHLPKQKIKLGNIRIFAGYSCLSRGESGMIEREDSSGRVIAAYLP